MICFILFETIGNITYNVIKVKMNYLKTQKNTSIFRVINTTTQKPIFNTINIKNQIITYDFWRITLVNADCWPSNNVTDLGLSNFMLQLNRLSVLESGRNCVCVERLVDFSVVFKSPSFNLQSDDISMSHTSCESPEFFLYSTGMTTYNLINII